VKEEGHFAQNRGPYTEVYGGYIERKKEIWREKGANTEEDFFIHFAAQSSIGYYVETCSVSILPTVIALLHVYDLSFLVT
jgi:hypothetical protein